MYENVDKKAITKNQVVSNSTEVQSFVGRQATQIQDNRPLSVIQRKQSETTAASKNHPSPESAGMHSGDTIQAMLFERFSGRFSNWGWYNDDEKGLLTEEKRVDELLTAMAGDREYGVNAQILFAELNTIKNSTYAKAQYGTLKVQLQTIFDKADALSSKIAAREFIIHQLLADFNSKPPAAMALQPLIDGVWKFVANPILAELGTMRNYLDMLTQFVSDAAMKSTTDEHMAGVKAPLLQAAVNIQKAYLHATVNNDLKAAETCMIMGTAYLHGINPRQLLHLAEEGDIAGAKPKQREAAYRIDTGSMMVARAALKAGVSPDLVVGLPTGGAHAASRFAAAAGIMSGKTPEVWLTRPQGVKEESKEFMKGTGPDALFKRSELKILVHMLGPRWEKARAAGMTALDVFVVDDGQVSGRTLQMTREIYEKELASAGIPARVYTGIVLGGNRDEQAELYIEKERKTTSNNADFVMNNSADRAGPRRVLERTEPEYMGGDTLDSHGERALDVQVTIVFNAAHRPESLKVKDLLTPVQTARL